MARGGLTTIYRNRAGTVIRIVAVLAAAGTAITGGVVYSGGFHPFSSPDALSPHLFLTAPADGATVSGDVTVTATCGDNTACAGVQFKLNGANLNAEDTSAPFSTVWDSATSGNGSYTLSAQARDAAGNSSGLANTRAVTVTSGVGGGPPVANLFVDSNGGTCTRHATPVAYIDADACSGLDAAYHAATIGDSVEIECGVYSVFNGTFTHDASKDAAAQGTYVTFRPPPGQTAPGYRSASFDTGLISGCVQLSTIDTSRESSDADLNDIGPSHIAIQDVAASGVKIGKNVSNSVYQGTVTDIKLTNVVTYNLSITSAKRIKIIGGQVGNMTSCGSVSNCTGYVSQTNGFTTLSTSGSGAENHIGCSISCEVGNSDILLDGVTFHDVYRNAAGSAHSACLGGIESTNGLTIRNSKFYNCDSQTLFFTFSTQSGSAANVSSNILLENNWIAPSTDTGGTAASGESIEFKSGGPSQTYTNVVVRNNAIPGGMVWNGTCSPSCSPTPLVASNFSIVGNLLGSLVCSGSSDAPTSGITNSYNIYTSSTGSCSGTGNTSAAFGLTAAPATSQSTLNYDLTGTPTACNFVPASAYAIPTTFTTAFGLYDPHAVLTTDLHGTARPSSTAYDAGAFEGC